MTRFQAIPTSLAAATGQADVFASLVSRGGYRIVLSGLGGDEILGGVPTPVRSWRICWRGPVGDNFVSQSMRCQAVTLKKPVVAQRRTSF